jgi:DNA-binding GntR family transcriptional regulator
LTYLECVLVYRRRCAESDMHHILIPANWVERRVEENFLKMMAGQPPLTADLLVNKIYTLLESNIINMTLPPESKLVEENIAHVLGVSRSPVREALMRLENAGLVVRKIGKGSVVASFTEQEIIDNYEVWEMIESFAGGLACLSAKDDDYRKIEDILNQMKELTGAEGDFDAHPRLNYSLHCHMVAPCPNKALVRMYENSLKPIKWCWNLSILWQFDLPHSYTEHKQIFDIYRQRDRAEYQTLVRKHIRDASERFRRAYEKRKSAGDRTYPSVSGVA